MQFKLLVASQNPERAVELCARVLEAAQGSIAAEAIGIAGAVDRAAATRPDVLLLELTPGEEQSAWQVLSRVHQVGSETRIMLLTDKACTPLMIIGFIQRGAAGCLLSSTTPSLIARAVTAVHRGETWFGRAALLQALRSRIEAPPVASAPLPDWYLLTAREQEVLGLIGDALSNKEIARQLRISDKTVKTHLHHIYVKLHRSGRYKALRSNGQ